MAGKRGSGKEGKLLSSAVTTLKRPGAGELSRLKLNWKKALRAESRDPPMLGKYYNKALLVLNGNMDLFLC